MNLKENNQIDANDALAAKIAALLDQGTQELDSNTAEKLLAARKEALAHFQQEPAHAWVPVAAGRAGRLFEPFSHNLRAGLVLLAVLAPLCGIVAWHTFGQQGSEIAEIDEALLTDELPINAYLEKGFDSWVKRHTR
jgi:Protein of unknown function (DUF3619)